jgi:hypothetical protein
MTRRAGITLTEVLVAIFVMGIGLISLLTLFPLGALNMAQSIKDDRCAQASNNADALFRIYWRQVGELAQANPTLWDTDPTLSALDNPALTDTAAPVSTFTNLYQLSQTGVPPYVGPGYPVVLDPIGHAARGSGTGPVVIRVAGNATAALSGLIPRRNYLPAPSSGTLINQAIRSCTLLDDITFGPTGAPTPVTTTNQTVERQGRYNWAFLIQKPDVSQRDTVSLTTIVYSGRVPDLVPANSEVKYSGRGGTGASVNDAIARLVVGSTRVQINYGHASRPKPNVRKGGWVMDGSVGMYRTAGGADVIGSLSTLTGSGRQISVPAALNPPEAPILNADFYRVIAVEDLPTGGPGGTAAVVLELQTPIKPNPGNIAAYDGDVYVLNNVIEVFERGLVSPTSRPAVE